MCEYCNVVDSNQWEPTDNKEKSKYDPLILKASTVAIEDQVNNIVEKVYFKIQNNGKEKNLE